MTFSRADLVCLHLAATDAVDDGPAPRARAATGICDAVGGRPGDDRLDVLATLDRLADEGYLEVETRPVAGLEGKRTVYALTAAGRERARSLRDALEGETVTVRRDGADVTVALEVVDEHLDVDSPLVTALIERERDAEGVVDLADDDPGVRFVDRERELHVLERVVWESPDLPAGAVLTGPSGVGKTRLVRELADRIEAAGGRVLSATADGDAADPFGLFKDLLEDVPTDGELPFAAVEGLDPDADAHSYEAQRKSLFYDILERLEAHARGGERPLLLVLDDVQRATDASLDLLTYLVDRLERTPLRLVCACNTGAVDDGDRVATVLDEITDQEAVQRLEVEPLSRDDVAAYLCRLLETDEVPLAFVDRIHERTEGNPLFVTALVRHLEAEGVVDPAADAYPTSESDLGLPETVRSVIDARLEAFADEHVTILEAAAVVGGRVSVPVLAQVLDRSESDLRDVAAAIVDSELCEAVDDSAVPLSRTFRFRNPVIRDAVLERVDADRRERLHERAGRAVLDVELTDDRATHAVAARHFERAGDEERALEQHRKAGDRAFDVFAHDAALEAYERALELARSLEREEVELEVLEEIADVRRYLGEYDAAEAAYEALLDRVEDTERRQRLHRKLCASTLNAARFERALSLAESGLELSTDSEGSVEMDCELLNAKGDALLHLNRYDEALAAFERGADLAEEIGDSVHEATAIQNIGQAWLEKGDLERAEPFLQEAVERTRDTDQIRILSTAYNNLGILHARRNDLETSLSYYERSRDCTLEYGDVRQVAVVNNNIGFNYQRQNDVDRALEYYREAREMARRIGETYLRTYVTQNIASISLRRGELEACLDTASAAEEIAERIDARERLASVAYLRALVFYYRGSVDEMATAVDRLGAISREIDEKRALVRALGSRGMLARLEGDYDAADGFHREAIELGNQYGQEKETLENRLELVLTCAARDDAETALEQADVIDSLSSKYDAETVALARGIASRLAGHYRVAADALETAIAESRERDDRVTEFRTLEQQARLALACEDDERARELATELSNRAGERGLELFVDRAEAILERTSG